MAQCPPCEIFHFAGSCDIAVRDLPVFTKHKPSAPSDYWHLENSLCLSSALSAALSHYLHSGSALWLMLWMATALLHSLHSSSKEKSNFYTSSLVFFPPRLFFFFNLLPPFPRLLWNQCLCRELRKRRDTSCSRKKQEIVKIREALQLIPLEIWQYHYWIYPIKG